MAIKMSDMNFIVPEEITYRQYYRLSQILGDIDLNSLKNNEGNSIDVNAVKNALFEGHKIPKLFSVLLVPVGGMWKPEYEKNNEELFFDIGDKTAMEVIESFLAGRGNLIESIVSFFLNFLKKSEELNPNSIPLKKNQETNIQASNQKK